MGTNKKRPTDAELAILRTLWERGPSTVREVYETLSAEQDTGYTTVLKLMQIMTDKGILTRDASVRPQVFRPARPQRQTQRQMLTDLLDRAFSGSPGHMVVQALSCRKTTTEERQQIRDLLDQLEEGSS